MVNAIPLDKTIENITVISRISDMIGALHVQSDQSIHFNGKLLDDIYPLVYTGMSKGHSLWHNNTLSKHMIETKGTQHEVDSLNIGDTDVRAILLPKSRVDQYLQKKYGEKNVVKYRAHLIHTISEKDITSFLDIHARILEDKEVSDQELEHLVLNILQNPKLDYTDPEASYELVHKAIKVMQENLHSPLLINELAMTLEVNIRTLELAFKKHFNVSPKCYYKRFLLQQIEMKLRQRSPKESTVSDVLEEYQIYNLSQFGASFKKYFDTTPSQAGVQCTQLNPFGWDESIFSQLLMHEESSA